jgi:hypothetical protein
MFEEMLKHLHAKAGSGFGKHTMVRDGFIQVVTEKPPIGHIHLNLSHQTTFRGYAIKIADEESLKENDWID